jgi:hypothetical protein
MVTKTKECNGKRKSLSKTKTHQLLSGDMHGQPSAMAIFPIFKSLAKMKRISCGWGSFFIRQYSKRAKTKGILIVQTKIIRTVAN